jgi:hypothetical protein
LSVFPHFGSRGFFLPMPRQTKVKPESQGSRLCTSCNKVKLLSQFETFKDGFVRGLCQQCVTLQKAKKTSATPESYLQVLNTQLKSQRLKQGVQYDLTKEDVVDLWETQNGKCALSGVLMTHQRDGTYGDRKKKEFNASIDRINPNGPYVRQNVQLVANRINTMKHTLSQDMFMWWIKNIHEHFDNKTTREP